MTEQQYHQNEQDDKVENLLNLFKRNEFQLTLEQLRKIRVSIDQVVNYQATVGVLGKSGAGKSSLCNALFGRDVAEVSDVEACTRAPQEITLAYKSGKGISLIDVPGVGESAERDEEYTALYRRLLPKLDLVLWVIKGDDRALSVDERVYKNVVEPFLKQHGIPVVFVISQIDKVEPCREWDWKTQCPGPLQSRNIDAKLANIRKLFDLPQAHLCAVSAEENYGLVELVERIVHTLPNEKKWGFTREAKPENVSSGALEESEMGLWTTIKDAASKIIEEAWGLIATKVSSWAGKLFGWP